MWNITIVMDRRQSPICSYIVACGILEDDGEGFYQIKDRNDPVGSALQVMAFAKDMLRASNQVSRLAETFTYHRIVARRQSECQIATTMTEK